MSNGACPENRVALEFFTVLKYILSVRIFEQLALALKNRVALKIFTVLNILFTFRIFEQFALALKDRAALEFFTVLKYILSFRIFEQFFEGGPFFTFGLPGGMARTPDPRQLRHCSRPKWDREMQFWVAKQIGFTSQI